MKTDDPLPMESRELAELERELRSLRPRAASPELGDRITDRMNGPLLPGRWYAPLALAASLAIAAMLIALLMLPANQSLPMTPKVASNNTAEPALDSSRATFIAYRHALNESEATLDALLDAHAKAHHKNIQSSKDARQTPLQIRSLLPS